MAAQRAAASSCASSSLRYLSFHDYRHPLIADALPFPLIHFNLGEWTYRHPLPPGVLPSSLRDLSTAAFERPLQPGALPEDLQFFRLRRQTLDFPLLPPDALPSTLLGPDLGACYEHPLPAGVVLHSVQWVRGGAMAPIARRRRRGGAASAHTAQVV